MVRVFCVLTKPKYSVDNVIKLRDNIFNNYKQSFEFVCLTDSDNEHPDIKFINVSQYDLDTWWNKVLIFDNKYSKDVNLYFDLDVIINSSIDPLISQLDDTHIFTVDTPWKNKQYFAQKYLGVRAYKIADALFRYGNSSVMGWRGNHQYLVDLLLSDIFTHTSKHYGDDTFIHQHGRIKHFNFDIKRSIDNVEAAIVI